MSLVFVDTNVLVYAHDSRHPDKQQRAWEWMRHVWQSQTGRLSFQVLSEFFQVVAVKRSPGLQPEDAQGVVKRLYAWKPQAIDAHVIDTAVDLHCRDTISWWDALIVSAALRQHCSYLLTEDMQHGRTFHGLTIISPFQMSPGDIAL